MHGVIFYKLSCSLQIVLVLWQLLNYMAVQNYCPVLNLSSNKTFQMWSLVMSSYHYLLKKFLNLSSDELSVSSEEIVFECVIRWVKHNSDSRKDILPKLMENVCFLLISAEFIHGRIKEKPLVNLSVECQRYVIEALCFHTLKLKHNLSSNITKSISTKPRKYTGLSKVIIVVG